MPPSAADDNDDDKDDNDDDDDDDGDNAAAVNDNDAETRPYSFCLHITGALGKVNILDQYTLEGLVRGLSVVARRLKIAALL